MDHLASLIKRSLKRTVGFTLVFFILLAGTVYYYSVLKNRENFIREQIATFSEIDAEAVNILYFASRDLKNLPLYDTTLHSSWMNSLSAAFIKELPNSRPDIILFGTLGTAFYSENFTNTNTTRLIQRYQSLSAHAELLKRLGSAYLENSPAVYIERFAPVIALLLLFLLLFSIISSSKKLKHTLITHNEALLDNLWSNIKADIPQEETPSISIDLLKENIFALTEEGHSLFGRLQNLHSMISGLKSAYKPIEDIPQPQEPKPEIKEQLLYIQKLLARLFTRAERAAVLAKAAGNNGFQAGILALNVSIEAARAGENGKQFLSVSEKIKDFGEKSTRIGEAILEELKDADLTIRKAYAAGKDVSQALVELPSSQNKTVSPYPFADSLGDALHYIEEISTCSIRVQKLASSLEEKFLAYSPDKNKNIEDINLIKEALIESFEKLYFFNYGEEPPIHLLRP